MISHTCWLPLITFVRHTYWHFSCSVTIRNNTGNIWSYINGNARFRKHFRRKKCLHSVANIYSLPLLEYGDAQFECHRFLNFGKCGVTHIRDTFVCAANIIHTLLNILRLGLNATEHNSCGFITFKWVTSYFLYRLNIFRITS